MDERNSTRRLRALMNSAQKKYTEMNKGSKLLLKIAPIVFFAVLVLALALLVLFYTGVVRFDNQLDMVSWMVLYSFRFWVVLVAGALILDILTKR
jgi:sterol desaturase/sphingolipid hydroxylase (fatty acid hydroxylase superfamily)